MSLFSRYAHHYPLSPIQKLFLVGYSSIGGFLFPKRGEMVSILGETSTPALILEKLHQRMMNDTVGREILRTKPIVNTSTVNFVSLSKMADNSFGKAYYNYMSKYGFTPEGRDAVKFIDDPELSYVLLRYRQIHDFLHVLSQLPASIEGETALKVFEFIQTGIPMTLLASVGGCLRFRNHSTELVWAVKNGFNCKDVMCIKYEDHFDRPLLDFRSEINLSSFTVN